MGVVYMAEQPEPVVRKVTLKIIKLGRDTRQVVASAVVVSVVFRENWVAARIRPLLG